MKARLGPAIWWQLTPVQRAMLKRVAREGALDRLSPWEGRTVRSLVARNLLRHRYRERRGAGAWFLTARGANVLKRSTETEGAQGPGPDVTRPGSPRSAHSPE